MRNLKKLYSVAAFMLALAGFYTAPARASVYVVIPDASTLMYSVEGGRVYLRNMNTYDSTWFPCCYNYWIDLSTDTGRAMFSTLLSYALSGKRLVLYKDDPSQVGAINIIGNF